MKTVLMALASVVLAAALSAAEGGRPRQADQAQPGTPTQQEKPGTATDYGANRLDKRGTDQTYNTGRTGQSVGTDTQNTYKNGQASQPIPQTRRRGAAGTGVATGFVAAGVGLALLGLFVRRRNRRHPDDPDYDDDDRRTGPPSTGSRV